MKPAHLLVLGLISVATAESYVSVGFSTSYSMVGGGYEAGDFDVNFGVKRFSYRSAGDLSLSPGASATYHISSDLAFVSLTVAADVFVRGSDEKGVYYSDLGYVGDAKLKYDDGITPGFVAASVGKRWKFSRNWSFVGDLGAATPMAGKDAFSGVNLVGGVGFNRSF